MRKTDENTSSTVQVRNQWHPAFIHMTEIDLREDKENLIYDPEWNVKKLPNRMDLLIRKRDPGRQVKKTIGNIFRTYNLVQYKSPADYLSKSDYYYLHGNASLLKAGGFHGKKVSVEEISLTFAVYQYPYKLVRYLLGSRNFEIKKYDAGIYHILGNHYVTQLVLLPELNPDTYVWLSSLKKDITENQQKKLMEEYFQHGKELTYQAAMEFVISINKNIFIERKDNDMCRALLEIYEPELKAMVRSEIYEKERQEIIEEARPEIIEEVRPEIIEEARPDIQKESLEKAARSLKHVLDTKTIALHLGLPEEFVAAL